MFNIIQDFVILFSSILWEALPFIVLGAIIAGLLEELLPQQLITRFLPSNPILASGIGGLLGLIFPMCECGIVVVMRRLLRKGLPLSCCISYMLAGPIVNGVVIFSTYIAFEPHGIGWTMVLLRSVLGFLIATTTGLIVYGLEKRRGTDALLNSTALPSSVASLPVVDENADDVVPKKPSIILRISNISSTALHDFIDITVFLILGAGLAAGIKLVFQEYGLDIGSLSREQPLLTIPAMMFFAVIMCLCSEADAFVAASFTKMTISSKIAFLVLGPMLDLKLILMFTRVFRLRLILTIIVSTVVLVGIASIVVHYLYDSAVPYVAT